jgi:hypothetical protein
MFALFLQPSITNVTAELVGPGPQLLNISRTFTLSESSLDGIIDGRANQPQNINGTYQPGGIYPINLEETSFNFNRFLDINWDGGSTDEWSLMMCNLQADGNSGRK